ncbi:hypothetical protein HDV01_006934 [Terramyces sp. JEL0728]|nr:hypothetical protein HDV01_006934 [Terramyces sp. JEL0728]
MLLILVNLIAAQTLQIGGACNSTAGDRYACLDSVFLQCNPATGHWMKQNQCSGPCIKDPTFAMYCANQTITTATASTSALTTIPTDTITPTSLPSTDSSTFIQHWWLWIVIGGILVAGSIVLAIYKLFLWKPKSFNVVRTSQISDVLQKKYVVIANYIPVQDDEIQLNIGDEIILEQLFSDGYAKVRQTNVGTECD